MPARSTSLQLVRLAPLAPVLWLAGCGYVGDPMPPALNLPQSVADLRAVERGGKLVLDFTIPPQTTENLPLKRVTGVELRAWAGDGQPYSQERMLANSQAIPAVTDKPGPVVAETPAAPWVGKEVFVLVRSFGPKHKPSGWSNLAMVRVVEPLEAPSAGDLAAEAVTDGVRVRWKYPALPDLSFRIYRAADKDAEREQVDVATASEWLDRTAEYGKDYRYWVQAVRRAGNSDAESDVTGPAAIRPEDKFPPSVPKGLNAVPGLNTIELTWDPNPERDLGAYRVYRALASGAFERLEEKVPTPSYSDRKVVSGKQYRYRVSSVDRLGNESEQSAPVESTAP